MRILQLARRYPLPAVAMLLVLGAGSFVGVKVMTPATSDAQTPVAAEEPAPPVMLAAQQEDSPFTTWTPGEYVEEPAPPTTEVKQSKAPMPNPNQWDQLASLDIASAEFTDEVNGSLAMPKPAGFDDSMNPFERRQLINSKSVENLVFPARGPVIRVGVGGGGDCP